jgi:CHAT domain-containing protein
VGTAQERRNAGHRDWNIATSSILSSLYKKALPTFQIGCLPPQGEAARQVAETKPESFCQLHLLLVTGKGQPILRQAPNSAQPIVLAAAESYRADAIACSPQYSQQTECANRVDRNAQAFYRWLVAPLEEDLQRQNVNNLVFILDRGLRTLPLAALKSPNPNSIQPGSYLVQTYSVGLMPSMSLTDTRYVSLKDGAVLAMGAATFAPIIGEDLPTALATTPAELALLQANYPNSRSFLDAKFDRQTLQQQRQQAEIVHLSTHARFKSARDSYIRLYQEQLPLKDIPSLDWQNPTVQLLGLSACQTAIGDDQLLDQKYQVELGFAGVAVEAGVNSSLASLWTVSESGTTALMAEFYRQLRRAPIKAEALRQAQLALLDGSWKPRLTEAWQAIQTDGRLPLPEATRQEMTRLLTPDRSLADPYFWSGFTLIGNPW